MNLKNVDCIRKKCRDFALEIIRIYRNLVFTHSEFVISKKLLRSGTGIGLKFSDALVAETDSERESKMILVIKDCAETLFWLEVLRPSRYLECSELDKIYSSGEEILSLVSSDDVF